LFDYKEAAMAQWLKYKSDGSHFPVLPNNTFTYIFSAAALEQCYLHWL